MQDTNDPNPFSADAAWAACLERTRSGVLNVLVGVGLTIAVGGWLLRWRGDDGRPLKPQGLHELLMAALLVVAIASYVVRRLARWPAAATLRKQRNEFRSTDLKQAAFYRSHVLAALIAALAAPMGIVYGWWIDPRLSAVIPFWVAAMALGFLAIPRAHELDDFDRSSNHPGASPP